MTNSFDKSWGIHWFRRDLRMAGNEALQHNWKTQKGCTLGFFCFDSTFLARPDFSHNRFAFFIETLEALKKEASQQGLELLVVDCPPLEAFKKLLKYLDQNSMLKPSLVTWSRDYEPYALQRDEAVKDFLQKENIEISTHRDHLIFEPYEVLKSEKENSFYQIYSPYARKWLSKLATAEGQQRLKNQSHIESYYKKLENGQLEKIFRLRWDELQNKSNFPFEDALIKFKKENSKSVTVPIPEAGTLAAFKQLKQFKKKIEFYLDNRDFPFLEGTSRLSHFLKNGSLTSSQVLSYLDLGDMTWDQKGGPHQFTKEIIWREFYYSILFHRPDVEKTSFLPQYAKLKWQNNEKLFQAWMDGTTGFPIVDAGMRELKQTGWMHNRVRMIVASFLTKDFLIDWKWGENYFMKQLLDGDLACNNGGWQWAASTGCDPQPYFRIFNPWLQGEKFDPDAVYIKKYVPELKSILPKDIHDPEGSRGLQYPKPLVDHAAQKEKAIKLYK